MAWKPIKQNNRQSEQNESITQNGVTSAQDGSETAGSATHQPETAAQPAPTPTSQPPAVAPVLPDLDSLIMGASPEQLTKLRMLVAAKGIAAPSGASGAKRADGSMTVEVTLDAPMVEQLELWAEADGCSVGEEAQKRISEALQNYLYGDWSAVIETPVAATEPVAK